MTEREYRQDDRSVGYCPVCNQEATGLTIAGRGYCDLHGWHWVNWNQEGGYSDPRPDPRTHPEYWTE